MPRDQLLIIAGAFLAAAYVVMKWAADQQNTNVIDPNTDTTQPVDTSTDPTALEDLMSKTNTMLGLWRAPAKYAQNIAATESQYGIPPAMLERLLYQESHYREDIITGKTRSPVGAVGIAQFMPATARDLGVDPLNPAQAIDGAGRYLASLYRQTGSWKEALASYNWGVGNVKRKGLGAAPTETRNYFVQILADVNNANGTAFA